MNTATLVMTIAGLSAFAAGAIIAATSDRAIGIGLMAIGLALQVLTLRQMKRHKTKGTYDAGG